MAKNRFVTLLLGTIRSLWMWMAVFLLPLPKCACFLCFVHTLVVVDGCFPSFPCRSVHVFRVLCTLWPLWMAVFLLSSAEVCMFSVFCAHFGCCGWLFSFFPLPKCACFLAFVHTLAGERRRLLSSEASEKLLFGNFIWILCQQGFYDCLFVAGSQLGICLALVSGEDFSVNYAA